MGRLISLGSLGHEVEKIGRHWGGLAIRAAGRGAAEVRRLRGGHQKLLIGIALAAVITPAAILYQGASIKPAESAPICQYTIGLSVTKADGTGNFASVKPGDTVCIQAGSRQALTLVNFRGQAGNPITFVNSGGVVTVNSSATNGIAVMNSVYVRVTGTGASSQCGSAFAESQQQCGIRILGGVRGITIAQRSSYVETDHLDISGGTGEGVNAKTPDSPRAEFTQYDTWVHHNFIHDVKGAEGMYIGSSHYTDGSDPLLKGVTVDHNLVARTGWDGIQVGSAVERCSISDNRIISPAQDFYDSQKSGMMINPGSVCNVSGNYMADSASKGIFVQGNGGNRIYNNVIVRPGRRESASVAGSGIQVTTGSNTSQSIEVINNTIVSPKGPGVHFGNTVGSSNRIQNNLVTDAAGAAISIGSGAKATNTNNLGLTIAAAGFANPAADDYSLSAGSPAINAGTDLRSLNVTTDFRGTSRPQGSAFDVGAFEYASGGATATPVPTKTATPISTPAPTKTPIVTPTNTPAPTSPTPTPTTTPTPPAPTATPPTGSDVLSNRGFEADTNGDGNPDSWGANSHFKRVGDVVHSGSYAGKHSAQDNSDYYVAQDVKDVTSGRTYSFTGYVNIPPTSDAFSFDIVVRWLDAAGTAVRVDKVKSYTKSTSGWDQAAGTLTAPAGATQAKVRMVAGSLNATVYVDDFSLK